MTIPTAVATGGAGSAAADDDRVKPRNVAIVAGVLAVAVVYLTYANVALPARAVQLFGGATAGNARWGGVELRWAPPAGFQLHELQSKFEQHDLGALLHPDGDTVVVEIPRVTQAEAPDVVALVESGALEFREVIEGNSVRWFVDHGLAFDQKAGERREPAYDVDQWTPEDGRRKHIDYFLRARSKHVLEAAFAEAERGGWQRPPHTAIAYQHVEPNLDDRHDHWRSYFVSTDVPLDGMAVADAKASNEPDTNRPIVLLDFDRKGGEVFGELTTRITGGKLAMVVGGEVRSAPVINMPIRGGRASITMGGSDPRQMEHERDVLVATLRGGSLPIGGKVLDWKYVASTNGTAEQLAHVALAIGGGVAAALLAFLLVAFTRPERRRIEPLPGTGKRWRRALWTLLGIGLFAIGSAITIPWLNDDELIHLAVAGKGAAGHGIAYAGIFGLGITPLISAFVFVEIIASLVPRLRRYRDGGALRRRWLGLAVAIVAALTAFAQAYFIVKYMDSMGQFGVEIVDKGGRWPTILTFVTGTMLIAFIASLIGNRGIGNGYAVLLVAGWLIGLFRYWWWEGPLIGAHLVLAATVLVGIAIVTLAMLRWQVRAPRSAALPIPSSGLGPLNPGAGLALVVAQVLAVGLTAPKLVADALEAVQRGNVTGIVVVLAAAAVWSFVFAWPGRRRALLAKIDREPVTRDVWLRGAALTAGVLLAIYGLAHAAHAVAPELYFIVDPLVLVLVVASAADLVSEWRARRRDLVPVWPLHDPLLVQSVHDVLADIPHHIQATRLRGLLWLFGAFAPMIVLVPREDSERAETLLRDWLEP